MKIVSETGFFIDVNNLFNAPLIFALKNDSLHSYKMTNQSKTNQILNE